MKSAVALAGFVCALVAPEASAQISFTPKAMPVGEPELLAATASCVVKKSRETADSLFSTMPDSREGMAISEQLPLSSCIGGRRGPIQLDPLRLRGAIAIYFLKENDSALLAQAGALAATAPLRGKGDRMVTAGLTFRCAAASQPALVAKFLETDDAAQEAVALQDLEPTLRACVPEGTWMKIDSINVRPRLADALYFRMRKGAE